MSLSLVLAAIALGGCASAPRTAEPRAPIGVIDGHADFAVHYLRRGWAVDAHDIGKALPGQSDVPRWRTGGVNGALVTLGSDLSPGSTGHFPRVLASIDWFGALIGRHGDALVAARSAADFERADRDGRIALMAAIEGGDQIDGSLDNLRAAYARGVRSIGIVYDHHNAIGDGAMAMPSSARIAHAPHGGLSPFGRAVVAEMNRLGMIVDLSHAAEATALDAMRVSKAPIIFSHSGARALADSDRNLSDRVLERVAANGGMVMVSFVPYLATTEHWRWWSAGETRYAELIATHGDDEAAVSRGMAEWDAANPQPVVGVADVADQLDYVASVAGRDHVGIGSDFDGMGDFRIAELGDAAMTGKLLDELRRRGWNRADLEKLARGNFLRVLRRIEAARAD